MDLLRDRFWLSSPENEAAGWDHLSAGWSGEGGYHKHAVSTQVYISALDCSNDSIKEVTSARSVEGMDRDGHFNPSKTVRLQVSEHHGSGAALSITPDRVSLHRVGAQSGNPHGFSSLAWGAGDVTVRRVFVQIHRVHQLCPFLYSETLLRVTHTILKSLPI